MLVGLDEFGQVKDLYYDYVGLENHLTEEAVNRIGVWIDGDFSWFSDSRWSIKVEYVGGTMAGRIVAKNSDMEVEISILDAVYNERAIYLRKFTIHNQASRKRDFKLYLNHSFRMYGEHKRDTVYYDPNDNTIVHYKGRRIAVVGSTKDSLGIKEYSVGLSGIEGKEGTWKDAEDGQLSGNPIEHGTVDSTVSFENTVDTDRSCTFYAWVVMAKTIAEAKSGHDYVLRAPAEHLFETTQDYWSAWLKKPETNLSVFSGKVQDIYYKSLFVVRAHVDNTGGITASSDSTMLQYGRDNYSYVWQRDGAFTAMALDMAGYTEVSRRFFEFSNDVITEDGYFYHKYRSDKSVGSSWHAWIGPDGESRLPIQEDETALVVSALWRHYQKNKDLEFIESVYSSLIKNAANFILGFRDTNNLPFPTFDVWEQSYGVHTYTASCVYDALVSAANFAKLLGKDEAHGIYLKGASEVQSAIISHMRNEKNKYFYKSIHTRGGEIFHDETIDISSFYALFKFSVLDINDATLSQAAEVVENSLCCKTGIGGVGRYENDEYYRVSESVPGNPWIITSLWLAQYYIKKAKTKNDLSRAMEIIEWVAARSTHSGLLPEQVDPVSGVPLSACPLTWSHAEFVTTVIDYKIKIESL